MPTALHHFAISLAHLLHAWAVGAVTVAEHPAAARYGPGKLEGKMNCPKCIECGGMGAPIVKGRHLSGRWCRYERLRQQVLSGETGRWNAAHDWCNLTDQRGEGRHPHGISDKGLRYDGCGIFAPQFVSWDRVVNDLAGI